MLYAACVFLYVRVDGGRNVFLMLMSRKNHFSSAHMKLPNDISSEDTATMTTHSYKIQETEITLLYDVEI